MIWLIFIGKEEKIIKERTTEKNEITYHTLVIDERKTFTIEQIALLITESKKTLIYLHVLFATLMGLRKCEINGIKYSDIDFIHRKLYLDRQLGRRYVCCSTYGKPRGKSFIYDYFKELKENNNLPWHKLRTTYTTILAKSDFSMKAIAVLLGHASEIVTFENYTDKNEIIYDCLVELQPFIDSVLPDKEEVKIMVCDDIKTDIIMQEEFEKILAA